MSRLASVITLLMVLMWGCKVSHAFAPTYTLWEKVQMSERIVLARIESRDRFLYSASELQVFKGDDQETANGQLVFRYASSGPDMEQPRPPVFKLGQVYILYLKARENQANQWRLVHQYQGAQHVIAGKTTPEPKSPNEKYIADFDRIWGSASPIAADRVSDYAFAIRNFVILQTPVQEAPNQDATASLNGKKIVLLNVLRSPSSMAKWGALGSLYPSSHLDALLDDEKVWELLFELSKRESEDLRGSVLALIESQWVVRFAKGQLVHLKPQIVKLLEDIATTDPGRRPLTPVKGQPEVTYENRDRTKRILQEINQHSSR